MSKNFFANLGQRLNRSKFVRCLLSKFFVVVIIVISYTSPPEPLSQFQRNSKHRIFNWRIHIFSNEWIRSFSKGPQVSFSDVCHSSVCKLFTFHLLQNHWPRRHHTWLSTKLSLNSEKILKSTITASSHRHQLLYPPQTKLRGYILILMSVGSFVRSYVRPPNL